MTTAAYTDLLTDTLYLVVGSEVRPMFGGAPLTGLWSSKTIVRNDHPGFGWLRVNGEFDADVTVRIYGDGALYHTAVVSDNKPRRMPPGRFREWRVEVEGTEQTNDVTLATTAAELEATA